MKFVLFALALGAFAIGTTEFAPMGLLPVIAQGVHASIPSAGLLISAYAIGVMIGAPVMTLLLSATRRRSALLLLMAIFTIGNVLSALAPDYLTLLLSRLVTSMAHGAFFGLGSMVAAALVAKEKRAAAVSTMFLGLTIANIGGVPVATWIGNAVGWRVAFAGTAGLGMLAFTALLFALPRGEIGTRPAVMTELKVLARPAVLRALSTTVLGAGAMFTLYTYLAAILVDSAHATTNFVTAMLVLTGVGFTIGNTISGKLSDRWPRGTLLGFFILLGLSMFAFPILAHSQTGAAIILLVWGAAAFGLVPPLQMRVMQEAHDAPGLASSVNIGAFNLGNALGAAAGSFVIDAGLGYTWVAPVGGLLAVIGFGLVWAGPSGISSPSSSPSAAPSDPV
jgi:DHA1 family inner membrane transport protein